MTLKDDKVLMATLALRGVRFKHVKPQAKIFRGWLIGGWYWKVPQTQWVGAFKRRSDMLADAKNWFERKDNGNPVQVLFVPTANQEAIERA